MFFKNLGQQTKIKSEKSQLNLKKKNYWHSGLHGKMNLNVLLPTIECYEIFMSIYNFFDKMIFFEIFMKDKGKKNNCTSYLFYHNKLF